MFLMITKCNKIENLTSMIRKSKIAGADTSELWVSTQSADKLRLIFWYLVWVLLLWKSLKIWFSVVAES